MDEDLADIPVLEPVAEPVTPPRSMIGLEVAVILLLAVVPDLFQAIAHLVWEANAPDSFAYMALSMLVRSAQVSAPVLLLVWYRQGTCTELGLVRPRLLRDGLISAGTFVVSLIGVYTTFYMTYFSLYATFGPAAAEWLYGPERDAADFMPAASMIDLVLLLPLMSLANGFAEELVTRGYLIPQFEKLTNSTAAAVLISTLLFAGYHVYQGPYGVLSAGAFGFTCSLVFCRTRRLWPLVVAHAAMDYLAAAFA
jgi:membrane protease YdiL (CAAX protease family)